MKKILIIIGGSIAMIAVAVIRIVSLTYMHPHTTSRSTDMFRTFSSFSGQKIMTGFEIQTVVTGLEVPRSIAFTSPDRMLVTERPGRLRVILSGQLVEKPLYTFTDISSKAEEGLMGLAIDPDYENNHFIYLSYAYPADKGLHVRVVRFVDMNDMLTEETVIFDYLPAAQYHAGCRIAFGPDGKLYVTVGDATERGLAQDTGLYNGKILRMNSDGSIPVDNPFSGSAIWSYGHRNPQGIDWDSQGNMYSSEHGPSLFDGPAGGDEINQIVSGSNYGRPVVSHEDRHFGMIDPLLIYTPAVAPAALLVYTADRFPQWKGDLLIGALKGEGIIHAYIYQDERGYTGWDSQFLSGISLGRIREVTQ